MVVFEGTPKLFTDYVSEQPLASAGISKLMVVSGAGAINRAPIWFVSPLENGTDEPVPATQAVIAHALRPSQAGLYFAVDYSSERSDAIIYGYTASIKRTGTGAAQIAVGAQLNAHEMSTAGSPTSIFGGATEAWTGNSSTEPSISATLIGWEAAVISQRHDNTQRLVGINSVFKNRSDGATTLLHGSIGSNKYNYNSRAILISSQTATATGEYCGWKYGIYFDTGSMDLDTDGGAIGIDMANVLATKLAYAIRIPGNSWIGLNGTGVDDIKMRYLNTSKFIQFSNGASEYIGFDLSSGAALALRINTNKVVGIRKTGWAVATGTATRTTFATSTVTLSELAERVKALIDDLHATAGHGLIGT